MSLSFTEFREKYKISQGSLHKLVLEAYELYDIIQNEMEEFEVAPEDYEFDAGSWRDEQLYGFLQLLMNNDA